MAKQAEETTTKEFVADVIISGSFEAGDMLITIVQRPQIEPPDPEGPGPEPPEAA